MGFNQSRQICPFSAVAVFPLVYRSSAAREVTLCTKIEVGEADPNRIFEACRLFRPLDRCLNSSQHCYFRRRAARAEHVTGLAMMLAVIADSHDR